MRQRRGIVTFCEFVKSCLSSTTLQAAALNNTKQLIIYKYTCLHLLSLALQAKVKRYWYWITFVLGSMISTHSTVDMLLRIADWMFYVNPAEIIFNSHCFTFHQDSGGFSFTDLRHIWLDSTVYLFRIWKINSPCIFYQIVHLFHCPDDDNVLDAVKGSIHHWTHNLKSHHYMTSLLAPTFTPITQKYFVRNYLIHLIRSMISLKLFELI